MPRRAHARKRIAIADVGTVAEAAASPPDPGASAAKASDTRTAVDAGRVEGTAPAASAASPCVGPKTGTQASLRPVAVQPSPWPWASLCCRRRRGDDAGRTLVGIEPAPDFETDVSATVPPVRTLQGPADPDIAAEWAIVESAVDADEFRRLQQLRHVVEARGFDEHPACAKEPLSQRAATLLRFLRARGGNVQQAAGMLGQALDWRRDFQIDEKMAAWRAEMAAGVSARAKLFQEYGYVKVLGRDADGLPVTMSRLSQADPGGLVREAGLEAFLIYMVRFIEDDFAEAQAQMLRTGKLLSNFVYITDLGNYGLVPRWVPRALATLGPIRQMTPIMDTVYPERVRAGFILRAPEAFSMIWRMVLPLIPESTRTKIFIKGFESSSYIGEVEALVPKDLIPAFLSSDDPALLPLAEPWGGIVPVGALEAMQ